MYHRILPLFLAIALAGGESARSEMCTELSPADISDSNVDECKLGRNIHYGEKGLEYVAVNSDTALWIGLRFQTRYNTYNGNLVTVEDLQNGGDALFDLRRGRVKGGGTLWWNWLEVYSEYNFPTDTLLDYRVTATHDDRFSFRYGQWKADFNRERIDSSGKQQFVERSISNYWFTVDRQLAFSGSARLAKGTHADTHIWVEALSGQGRGGAFDNNSGLWLGRWQWNPAGKQLPFSQSDLERRPSPLPSIALATIIGRTPYTRFSTSGGGELPGFDEGDYNLNQLLFETALHYRGLSWQQELHWKRIEDRNSGNVTRLVGGYAQLGSFLDEWWPDLPRQLELAGRVAIVDPDRDVADNTEWEWTLGANWFINGHRNKFTADVSALDFESPLRDASQWRFRLQWELSI
jgi:phosphate-selective porin OprO and OprP